MLNFYNEQTTEVKKLYIPLVLDNKAIGREPNSTRPAASEGISLQPNHATMDDCVHITTMLRTSNLLKIGFLKLESRLELAVTAVYTVMESTSKAISMEIEQIQGIKVG